MDKQSLRSDNLKKVSKQREKKEALVELLSTELTRATTIVLADYRGLTMAQLQELRNKLAETEARLTVTKNTLLKIALSRHPGLVEGGVVDAPQNNIFSGPTALIVGMGEAIAPLRVLVAFAKQYQLPKIKGGFLNQELLSAARMEELAKLPGKTELIGQVIGAIGAPLYGMVHVLQANLRNLVFVLKAIEEQKSPKEVT